MFRLLLAIPIWTIFIVFIFLPLCLLGYILVPLALICKAYKKVPNNIPWKNNGDDLYEFTWPFMFPYNNVDDGFYCKTYFDHGFFLTSLRWTLIRNPVNNLRIVPYFSCKINPENVKFIGSFANYDATNKNNIIYKNILAQYDTKIPQYFFAWQGIYSNIYWQFNFFGKLRRLWIGWKIFPTDIYGVTEYRKEGAGFAIQFKKVE